MNTIVQQLQERISQMEAPQLEERSLPTDPALSELLPGGCLRRGSCVSVTGSVQLALALLAGPSRAGLWCGAVGSDGLGLEAVAALGIPLERLILIPSPGVHEPVVLSTLCEVLSAVLLIPSGHPFSNRDRFLAKLRKQGASLIVCGPWRGAESDLRVVGTRWIGLGEGEGRLTAQELSVRSEDRRGILKHRVEFSGGRPRR